MNFSVENDVMVDLLFAGCSAFVIVYKKASQPLLCMKTLNKRVV